MPPKAVSMCQIHSRVQDSPPHPQSCTQRVVSKGATLPSPQWPVIPSGFSTYPACAPLPGHPTSPHRPISASSLFVGIKMQRSFLLVRRWGN